MHYNYFRDYDPGIGRYVQSDPIGLKAGTATYEYVVSSPLRYADPFGLEPGPGDYGTNSCSYYTERCKQDGGLYYCRLAPEVCGRTPDSRWTRCVRKCLQDTDNKFCERKDKNFCGGSDLPCVVNIHQMCWWECLSTGYPSVFSMRTIR